jgi:hypothetical protein
LTVPNVDLNSLNGEAPACFDNISIKFELFSCDLLTDPNVDIRNNFIKLIPEEPVFKILAEQTLVVQRASSGLHELFPVYIVFNIFIL